MAMDGTLPGQGERRPRNHLLRALPEADLARLVPLLEPVALPLRGVLQAPDTPLESLCFIESGTISMIATLADGMQVEVGLVGREGFIGLPIVLGAQDALLEALVQAEGHAHRLPASGYRAAIARAPALLPLLLRYADSFLGQVAQAAACNGHHRIEQRLARWILMMHDRVESDSFVMTQEFMAVMLGVRRPGVTLALGALKRAGLARHEKGRLHVLSRVGLEASSCACYAAVRERFRWLTEAERTNT